jgi:hypothetical protein
MGMDRIPAQIFTYPIPTQIRPHTRVIAAFFI